MNDESQLQVRPKDGDFSLTRSKLRSGLIARGRRDAAILVEPFSLEPTDALSVTRRLAEEGDADAQFDLAIAYYANDVLLGSPLDWFAEFIRWLRKAADQDHTNAQGIPEAQNMLGCMYESGDEGVAQDYAEAVRWFSKAAEQGDAYAQHKLGVAYYHGQGVALDHLEAAEWFRKAAEQGNVDAQSWLGHMYYSGQGLPQDYVEAARWWREVAETGDAYAQHALGGLYEAGKGVTQDPILAHMWFNLSASNSGGDDQKRRVSARDNVAKQLTPEQLADAQWLARDWRPKK